MTAQEGDRILYNGKHYQMASTPLNRYLKKRKDIRLVWRTTACWRGYLGTWEIKGERLYLIDFKAYIPGYIEVGLDYLFPGENEVFADWFTGRITIPEGKLIQQINYGYASIFEKYINLEFNKGVLVSESEIDYNEKIKEEELLPNKK